MINLVCIELTYWGLFVHRMCKASCPVVLSDFCQPFYVHLLAILLAILFYFTSLFISSCNFCAQGPAASTKTVAREGDNSLLLNQNPSVFTVFYRMRNLLLQEQLVGRFNNRLVAEGGETGEGEEEEGQGWEDDELEGVEISKVEKVMNVSEDGG